MTDYDKIVKLFQELPVRATNLVDHGGIIQVKLAAKRSGFAGILGGASIDFNFDADGNLVDIISNDD